MGLGPLKVRLYHGEAIDCLARIPDDFLTSVVCDPDYGIDTGSNWERLYDASPPEKYQKETEVWAREVLRAARPGAHLVAFGGSRTIHRQVSGVEDAGWEIRDAAVWHHGTGQIRNAHIRVDGWSVRLQPMFDPIIIARKPLSEKTVTANFHRWGTGLLNIEDSRVDGKWPGNVFQFRKRRNEAPEMEGTHTAVKPLDLMRYLVRMVTPVESQGKRSWVLDPFCGSGSTVEAALLEGVNVVGIDRVDRFIQQTQMRIDRSCPDAQVAVREVAP